jgi:predicted nucleic acid-binding protein
MSHEIVLADTTVWIHFLRGSGVKFQERLGSLIMADKLAITSVIIMEILRGAKSQKDYDQLNKDLAAVHCFDITPKVWKRACKLGYLLRQNGVNVPLTDTLIAAAAQEHDSLLIHEDRHYEMIAAIAPLRHEYISRG